MRRVGGPRFLGRRRRLGEPTLKTIARELVAAVRKNVTIDWTVRENVRAQLRVIVKRILRKYGYPPDKQEKATQTVLEQAEVQEVLELQRVLLVVELVLLSKNFFFKRLSICVEVIA
mgnify:CR=1 FL=1